MGGKEAILEIRKSDPDTPVLVLTGYFERGREALECGATKVLAKPMGLRELEEEIRQVVPAKG